MPAARVIFECPTCHQLVTRPLEPLPSDVPVRLEDGEAAVPEGYFALAEGDYWTGSVGSPLVNLADLVGTRHHPDPRRLNGCCGLHGSNGPNLVCERGHEIGTEKSDCWMAHAAVLLRNVTRRPASPQ
jgi:hypothetical protein